jgi:hypothetical protein
MSAIKVGLGIPFRSDNPSRKQALAQNLEILPYQYDWHTYMVMSDGLINGFNRAKARNNIVRALGPYVDVVVVCDADSFPAMLPLDRAIQEAYDLGGIHFPFDQVDLLGEDGSFEYSYGPSAGGCWVFKPADWWHVGGMDERLGSWGTDDRAFLVACQTLLGGVRQWPGALTCLWHERDAQTKPVPEHVRILEDEYFPRAGDPIGLGQYLQAHGATP